MLAIRQMRAALDVSQVQLAVALNISVASIQRYEQVEAPPLDKLAKIALFARQHNCEDSYVMPRTK